MPTAIRVTYRCPHCDNDLNPLLRLITSPVVRCRRCHLSIRINSDLIWRNWTNTFYQWAILVFWVGTILYFMASPPPEVRHHPPAMRFLGALLVGWLPGVTLGIPFLVLGMICGSIFGWWIDRQNAPDPSSVSSEPRSIPRDEDWR